MLRLTIILFFVVLKRITQAVMKNILLVGFSSRLFAIVAGVARNSSVFSRKALLKKEKPQTALVLRGGGGCG